MNHKAVFILCILIVALAQAHFSPAFERFGNILDANTNFLAALMGVTAAPYPAYRNGYQAQPGAMNTALNPGPMNTALNPFGPITPQISDMLNTILSAALSPASAYPGAIPGSAYPAPMPGQVNPAPIPGSATPAPIPNTAAPLAEGPAPTA